MLENKISVKIIINEIISLSRWSTKTCKVVGILPYKNEKIKLKHTEGSKIFHISLNISLYRGETEGYLLNLSTKRPKVYVMSRFNDDSLINELLVPFHATVCPYEAQDYSDDTDTQIDAVEMPEFIYLILTDFVNKNHKEETFIKRKKTKISNNTNAFSRKPPSPKRKLY